MSQRVSALLLAGALLCSLCACGTGEQTGAASSSMQGEASSSQELSVPEKSEIPVEEEQPLEPIRSMEWEETHTLDTDDRPENHGGLELPVRGATGYTSVELGLWEIRPDLMPEPEPKPEPEPEPQPENSTQAASSASTPPPVTQPSGSSETAAQGNTTAEEAEPGTDVPPAGQTQATQNPAGETADPAQSQPAGTGEGLGQGDKSQPAASSQGSNATDGELEGEPIQSAVGSQSQPIVQPEPVPEPQPQPTVEPEPKEEQPEPDPYQGALAVLAPGTPFTILEEQKDWWRVRCSQGTGWVEHRYCMINLPDVIPSMVYCATNSFDSLYRTSGKEIPGVTGEAFYTGKTYNERLGREEYMMPVLYTMALKLSNAQQAALEEGNTLVLYEGYRPYRTQKAVRDAVSKMAKEDPQVKAGVSDPPWSQTWFISNGYSNHQKGFAIDVSLGKVWETKVSQSGDYSYLEVTDYTLYEMPTPMHELSQAAATFTAPVSVNSTTAWKSAQPAASMNEPAFGLQRYCTQAGLTPLSSEWWHFNDLEARGQVLDRQGTGGFEIKTCRSTSP